jgi:hypothetical protein
MRKPPAMLIFKHSNFSNFFKVFKTAFAVSTAIIACNLLLTLTVYAKTPPPPHATQSSKALPVPSKPPQAGDAMSVWLKDAAFKKLYAQSLKKSPLSNDSNWAYKDIGLGPSQAFAGPNAETWVRVSTCGSLVKAQCRLKHIEIFYDVENQMMFAYLRLGSRVGWLGNDRGPTSLEQRFFEPLLTANALQ